MDYADVLLSVKFLLIQTDNTTQFDSIISFEKDYKDFYALASHQDNTEPINSADAKSRAAEEIVVSLNLTWNQGLFGRVSKGYAAFSG